MYCILVAGMPASGKSTIAVRISESLGIPMLSKDSIKEVLFDDLGFHSRAEKVQLGTAAMHILYYAAAQLMKVGKPFILENNFEDASIPGIMALLETHHYTAVTVRLTGDPEVIYRRFAARDLSDTRHRGHVVNDCYPEPPGAPLENPTRKSYEQFLDDIADPLSGQRPGAGGGCDGSERTGLPTADGFSHRFCTEGSSWISSATAHTKCTISPEMISRPGLSGI